MFEYTSFSTGKIRHSVGWLKRLFFDGRLFEEEVIHRINDYAKEGWELIWIDKTPRFSLNFLVLTIQLHSERTFYFRRTIGSEFWVK